MIKHVISGSGAHRIECGSVVGELVPYRQIARLEADGRVFCATTEYWAGTLPPMFEIRPIVHTEDYRPEGIPGPDAENLAAALALVNKFSDKSAAQP